MSERYLTGTGQVIWVHDKAECKGPYCVIHNPSDHHMRSFKTHWRQDRGIIERICPHGVGHPDPDDTAFVLRVMGRVDIVHGCDGCCSHEPR